MRNSDLLLHTTRIVCPSQNGADSRCQATGLCPGPSHQVYSLGTHPLFSGKAHSSISRLHIGEVTCVLPAPGRMPAPLQSLLGSLLPRWATRGRCRSSASRGLAAAALLHKGSSLVLRLASGCQKGLFPAAFCLAHFFPPRDVPSIPPPTPGLSVWAVLSSLEKSQEFAAPTLGSLSYPWGEGAVPGFWGEPVSPGHAEGLRGGFQGPVGSTCQAETQGQSLRETPTGHSAPTPSRRRVACGEWMRFRSVLWRSPSTPLQWS